jgi:hypothetical protein
LIADTGKNTLLACYHVGVYANRKMLGAGFGEDLQIATAEASKNAPPEATKHFIILRNLRLRNKKLSVENINGFIVWC